MNVIFCFVCVCVFVDLYGIEEQAMKEDRKKIMKGLFSLERKNKSLCLIIFSKKVFFCDFCVCDKCVVMGVCSV